MYRRITEDDKLESLFYGKQISKFTDEEFLEFFEKLFKMYKADAEYHLKQYNHILDIF